MTKQASPQRALWIALLALAAAFLTTPLLAEGAADDWACNHDQKCNGKPATICGDNTNETIEGTDEDDVIHGGQGRDTIHGKGGQDTICGGQDNDTIYGGDGRDWLSGGGDRDTLHGGKGGDFLTGGPNPNDKCYGEEGHDEFGAGCETTDKDSHDVQ